MNGLIYFKTMETIINKETYTYNSHITNECDGVISYIVEFDVTGGRPRKYVTVVNTETLDIPQIMADMKNNLSQPTKFDINYITNERVKQIKNATPEFITDEITKCHQAFDMLWEGLTMAEAQAVLDKFSSNAVDLFIKHKQWQDFIKQSYPEYEPLEPPYNVIFNQDGTVTLTEK
jgi:hypothetical protein